MAKKKQASIEYKGFSLPAQFPVLLCAERFSEGGDPGARTFFFHNYPTLGICVSGSGSFELYGNSVPFQENDIAVIPKNVPHAIFCPSGGQCAWKYIVLDPEELFQKYFLSYVTNLSQVKWSNLHHDSRGYLLDGGEYPGVRDLMRCLVQELEEEAPGYQLSVQGLLMSLYTKLYYIDKNGGRKNLLTGSDIAGKDPSVPEADSPRDLQDVQPIFSALDYIEKHYMQSFTIAALAEVCYWSPTHFRRKFHEIMGVSPLDYLNQLRIIKSCELLQNTEKSVLEISGLVGFRSLSSYNRHFQKLMQYSPREFRRQFQQEEIYPQSTVPAESAKLPPHI